MPESQTGIELKLENGNVIKAENAEEALKIAAKMIEDNSRAYRETKSSLDTLQGQFQTQQQQIDAMRPKEAPSGKFSNDHYFKLLNEDPIGAQNYLDAERFGIERPEYVPQRFNEMYTKVSAMEGSTLAAQFVNKHQDFPQEQESSQALTERIDAFRKAGHPVTIDTMDMAYTQLVAEGKIKPIEVQEEREDLPPSLYGSRGDISADEVKKAEAMNDKELQAYLKSKNML